VDAFVENVVIEPLERVRARDVEEDGERGLRACHGEREPEGRVALALAEQFESRFKEPGGGVGCEAVEQVKPELPDADALDRLSRQVRGVRRAGVEVAAYVEDEPAAVEVERLDEQMVDDASSYRCRSRRRSRCSWPRRGG